MTTFRLWSHVHANGQPTRNSCSDWWAYCFDCARLSGPHSDQDAALADEGHTCQPKVPKPPKPKYMPTPPARPRRVWTAAEDELIRQLPLKEAAKAVGAHRTTVAIRRRELGLVRALRTWTAAEDEIVTGLSVREAADRLGMTERAIRSRREQLARKARARAAA